MINFVIIKKIIIEKNKKNPKKLLNSFHFFYVNSWAGKESLWLLRNHLISMPKTHLPSMNWFLQNWTFLMEVQNEQGFVTKKTNLNCLNSVCFRIQFTFSLIFITTSIILVGTLVQANICVFQTVKLM